MEDMPGDAPRSARRQLAGQVYPALAVAMALRKAGVPEQTIYSLVETYLRQRIFGTILAGVRLVALLPDPFPLVRRVLRMMTRQVYPPGAQILVEDNSQCFALTVTRCHILETLQAHNAGYLAPAFCASDDWLSACVHQIAWERTQTLARGGACCDFRWRRQSPVV